MRSLYVLPAALPHTVLCCVCIARLAAAVDPNKRPRADRKLWNDQEAGELMTLVSVRAAGWLNGWVG